MVVYWLMIAGAWITLLVVVLNDVTRPSLLLLVTVILFTDVVTTELDSLYVVCWTLLTVNCSTYWLSESWVLFTMPLSLVTTVLEILVFVCGEKFSSLSTVVWAKPFGLTKLLLWLMLFSSWTISLSLLPNMVPSSIVDLLMTVLFYWIELKFLPSE